MSDATEGSPTVLTVGEPVSMGEYRMHLTLFHGVFTESWLTTEDLRFCHQTAHADADAGHPWRLMGAHSHHEAKPLPPPRADTPWW